MPSIKKGISKIANWIREEDVYDDEIEDSMEMEEEYDDEPDVSPITDIPRANTAGGKVVKLPGINQMKVVIVEPRKYEDVTVIADHIKQKKSVIMNLEGLSSDQRTQNKIFNFMSGAIYVLDGSMQRVSNSIFILAPSNVDIDANMKKELESKAFFPWQK